MGHSARAIIFSAPNVVDFLDLELPDIADDEIIVKTLYSMVSSGTELRCFSGKGEAEGRFPLIPGYSVVGEVVEVGANVRGFKLGDLVSGRNPDKSAPGVNLVYGGQCSKNIYATSGYCTPILLPSGANPLDYVVAEVSAISWRGANSADPQPGENVLVIGQGLVGALSSAHFVNAGCRVVTADVEPRRLARGGKWGVAATVNVADGNAKERIAALIPEGPDIVVEASATEAGLKLAYACSRGQNPSAGKRVKWPRVLLQASYVAPIPMHPTNFFPGEGVVLLSPGDRRPEDRLHAVEQLRTGRMRAADFVDRVAPYTDAPAVYAQLRDFKNDIFSAVFDWSSAA